MRIKFTAKHMRAMFGMTQRQLQYWAKTNIIPSYKKSKTNRVYTLIGAIMAHLVTELRPCMPIQRLSVIFEELQSSIDKLSMTRPLWSLKVIVINDLDFIIVTKNHIASESMKASNRFRIVDLADVRKLIEKLP